MVAVGQVDMVAVGQVDMVAVGQIDIAAVDLMIEHQSMSTLLNWILTALPHFLTFAWVFVISKH